MSSNNALKIAPAFGLHWAAFSFALGVILMRCSARTAVALATLLFCIQAIAEECQPLSSSYKLVRGPLTVAEIETESLAELRDSVPADRLRPMGDANARWEKFKAKLPDGAQLWKYRHSSTIEGRKYAEGGILALTPERCTISFFVSWLT